MNVWKKIGALTFALIVTVALSVSAFAGESEPPTKLGEGDGTTAKTGVLGAKSYANLTTDNLSKTVNIQKDIVVYNATTYTAANEKVAAPNFSYTYTVTPETTLKSVTDSANTSVQTKAGITTGLKVNNGTAGTATNAVGTYGFTNSVYFAAGSDGATNTYWIPFDFSGVDFTVTGAGYGVYRYKIVETLTQPDSGTLDYANLSMTNGTMNIVYLDVYVDGAGKIYGYVCLPGVVNEGASGVEGTGNVNVATSPDETTKINGFVKKATETAPDGADYYYTYDLTLSKTVVNDNYTVGQGHEFPFTVFFEQPDTDTTQLSAKFQIVETVSNTGGASPSPTATGFSPAGNLKAWSGVVTIRDSANIVYSGIPCGIDAIVFETNDVSNVTYKVTTAVSVAATAPASPDNAVVSATKPDSAAKQAASKADSQSTAVTFDTTVATALSTAQTCAITNELINISPTGVTMRYAPYLLTMGAGLTVLPLSRRYKKREEDMV